MTEADDPAWLEDLRAERKWREAHYTDEDGPLSDEALAAFPGLDWYPPDPAYRFTELPLHRHDQPQPADLAATGDDAVEFVEVGVFRFELHGEDCELTVFEPAPGEVDGDQMYLFIPFADATSGDGTYGGGRYLDLEPNDEDVYELDLNRAYHPYCVFDDSWVCTLPPPKNRLGVPVRAGERL